MEDETLVLTLLVAISRAGTTTLAWLIDELEDSRTPSRVARALQTARSRGLVELLSGDVLDDARYALTATGADAIDRRPPQRGPENVSRIEPGRIASVSLSDMLAVLADFDRFGGASIELVAWELWVAPTDISPAWSRAMEDGLLEWAGTDHTHDNEELWRLSQRGWSVARPRSDSPDGDRVGETTSAPAGNAPHR